MRKFDWEAVLIAMIGITVFAILAITPAWADQRYVEPNKQETICINYIVFSSTYLYAPSGSELEQQALRAVEGLGLAAGLLQGLSAIGAGSPKPQVFAHMYKQCLAVKGDKVS